MYKGSQKSTWLQTAGDAMSQSRRLRRYFGRPYLRMIIWIWNHLPVSSASSRPGYYYGAHLHRLIQLRSNRRQNVGTFFFRNRPEIELLVRLSSSIRPGSNLEMAILRCSKGAEVYSFSYSIRSARPDLNLPLHALDTDPDVLEFASKPRTPWAAILLGRLLRPIWLCIATIWRRKLSVDRSDPCWNACLQRRSERSSRGRRSQCQTSRS
jgi:hypothetical protein